MEQHKNVSLPVINRLYGRRTMEQDAGQPGSITSYCHRDRMEPSHFADHTDAPSSRADTVNKISYVIQLKSAVSVKHQSSHMLYLLPLFNLHNKSGSYSLTGPLAAFSLKY